MMNVVRKLILLLISIQPVPLFSQEMGPADFRNKELSEDSDDGSGTVLAASPLQNLAVNEFTSSHSDSRRTSANHMPSKDSIASILQELAREQVNVDRIAIPWWQDSAGRPISSKAHTIPTSIDDLVQLGLINAAKLKVAGFIPQIRRTAVTEADAEFDWNSFASTMWRDISDPVGSSLTIGGLGGNRFRDHDLDLNYGLRNKNRRGGNLELLQQWGFQDNNSTFFIPNDQATTRFILRYTQPLMRGRGEQYNQSLVVLANIDVHGAQHEYMRQLQSHLLEISQAYWALYLERVNLAQRIRLFLKTQEVEESLRARQKVDAGKSQVARAQAALEARKSDLIRAHAAIKNAETRLRALINAPDLEGEPHQVELLPTDHPIVDLIPADLDNEFQTALRNRPEIRAAVNSIKAACVRLKMAKHEVLPMLNLITESYIAGLRGNSDFSNAWLDQFRTGEPSYSVGLEFEVPRGRRASKARLTRRQLERAQLQQEYRNVLELTRAEVEIAVRELQTSHRELVAKERSLEAAALEAETIEFRWKNLADQGSTGGLMLDSLLRAQERLTNTEFEFAKAQLTYNLAIINLRHANGTLFQSFPTEIFGQQQR
ncbi:MAG: TolC family protein [Planctomycetota bacterium]